MKLSFYQQHQTRKVVALLTFFAFVLVPMTAVAEYCDTGCSGLDDGPLVVEPPPLVKRLIEIGTNIYNDIVEFFTGDSDSGSCSNN